MQKKCLLLFLFFIFQITFIFAQVNETDRLLKVINAPTTTFEKINAYKKLSNIFITKDFDRSLALSQNGFSLAKINNAPLAQIYFLKQIGLAYYFKGNYDSAANYYYKGLAISKGLSQKENTNEAELEQAELLNEFGKLFRKTKDLKRALMFYDDAYLLYAKRNNLDGMATVLNESGVVFEYEKKYDEAIARYKKSLSIREKMNDDVGKAYSLNFIGGALTLQKKIKEAENYLTQSLNLRIKLKDSFAIALNYSDLGYMYNVNKDFTNATIQFLKSNAIAEKINYHELKLTNYKELANIEKNKSNYLLALQYNEYYDALKDSLYTKTKMQEIEVLNVKYETEKRETQIQLQETIINKKNYFIWGITIVLFLICLAAFSIFKKRQSQNKLALQTEIMYQQSIATKAIIEAEENERKRIAGELHDGVGQMMSVAKMNLSTFKDEIKFENEIQKSNFENVISMVDESCKEVRQVSHQMMPNALLKSGLASAVREFISKIDDRIIKVTLNAEGLNERLDSDVETVLYRVIQECVNNVLKHAKANYLDISIIKDADGIAATIEDNGKGFDSKNKENFEGIGLKNMASRISYLKGTIDFDSKINAGTVVAIHIPNK